MMCPWLCDSAIKRRKLLPWVTARVKLEATVLSEIRHRQRQSHLHVESLKKKKSQTPNYQNLGRGGREL